MASKEARRAAILDASRMVNSGNNPWLRRAGDPSVRELFRNTVTVADEDPPGMEFRLLIQREFQSEGNVCFVTESKPLAAMELKRERERYKKWEPSTRLWMEQRVVGTWTESEG